ncbi:hypothetical protein O3M35_012786 [Rhynocoris fuscipes]|uniref:C-factor n=1 Tax=Rhynocoris fuscipes TaxID=488301 RepID=A0AAW1CEH4_9HEMI
MNSILITGANRGIGLGLVKAFINSERNPNIIVAACRKPNEATDLQKLAENHKNINILQLEVNKFETFKDFAKNVSNIVQNNGLNLLVNNAGISHKFLRIGSLQAEPMMEEFAINCVAPLMLSKELLPLLKQAAENNKDLPICSQRAAIVNISSILGSISDNDQGGFYPYRCSKSALNAATKSLSIDLKPYNILAMCLHPGWIKTSMGGPKAPLEVDTACATIVHTISNLACGHNGGFFTFEGRELKW